MALRARACPPPRPPLPARCRRGFTLLELLVALAAVAILAAVAYPAYTAQVAAGRRADAKQALMELSQRLERRYTERGSYLGATLGSDGLYPSSSRAGHYGLAITALAADSFTLQATPRGAQAGDACASFTYNHLGEQGVGAGASLSASKCW